MENLSMYVQVVMVVYGTLLVALGDDHMKTIGNVWVVGSIIVGLR